MEVGHWTGLNVAKMGRVSVGNARPHPGLVASQAHHKSVAREGSFASRNVVPRGEGEPAAAPDRIWNAVVISRSGQSGGSVRGVLPKSEKQRKSNCGRVNGMREFQQKREF